MINYCAMINHHLRHVRMLQVLPLIDVRSDHPTSVCTSVHIPYVT